MKVQNITRTLLIMLIALFAILIMSTQISAHEGSVDANNGHDCSEGQDCEGYHIHDADGNVVDSDGNILDADGNVIDVSNIGDPLATTSTESAGKTDSGLGDGIEESEITDLGVSQELIILLFSVAVGASVAMIGLWHNIKQHNLHLED